MFFFFFKQKTAYEMRISDWSSDVCSSDLVDKQDVARAVRRVGCGREQNGLIGIGVTARAGVRQEAFRLERPEQAIERYEPIFTRSEEHTSELQSLMRISYAVFCLKKKKED